MLVAGDEIGRTQKGNNNAYCQDNEISWLDWNNMDHELLAFVKRLIQLRKEHPIFCRTRWFKGEKLKGGAVEDIAWFLPEGTQMTDENWNHDFAKSLAVFMNGKAINAHTFEYKPITDDNFYIIFNAHFDPLKFVFPGVEYGDLWIKIIDTAHIEEMDKGLTYKCGTDITVEGRSVIVLQHKNRN
jgi:glycogen operon protein